MIYGMKPHLLSKIKSVILTSYLDSQRNNSDQEINSLIDNDQIIGGIFYLKMDRLKINPKMHCLRENFEVMSTAFELFIILKILF